MPGWRRESCRTGTRDLRASYSSRASVAMVSGSSMSVLLVQRVEVAEARIEHRNAFVDLQRDADMAALQHRLEMRAHHLGQRFAHTLPGGRAAARRGPQGPGRQCRRMPPIGPRVI